MTPRVLALSALLVACAATIPAEARSPAELRQVRVDAASRAHAAALAAYNSGTGVLESVYLWSVRWLQAERTARPADAPLAATRHRARMDLLATEVGKRIAAGLTSPADSDAVAYYQAEAELWASGEPG